MQNRVRKAPHLKTIQKCLGPIGCPTLDYGYNRKFPWAPLPTGWEKYLQCLFMRDFNKQIPQVLTVGNVRECC